MAARTAPRGHVYHVLTRGNNGQAVFEDDNEDRSPFLRSQVSGHDSGKYLISFGDDLKKGIRIFLLVGRIVGLINNQTCSFSTT